MAPSTPAEGAFTSSVTLSVSNSTSGSSAETASPACFSQRATVALETLSPSAGTVMSTPIGLPFSERPDGPSGDMDPRAALFHRQRRLDQCRLLLGMHLRQAGGRARRGRAADIDRTLRLVLQRRQHPL